MLTVLIVYLDDCFSSHVGSFVLLSLSFLYCSDLRWVPTLIVSSRFVLLVGLSIFVPNFYIRQVILLKLFCFGSFRSLTFSGIWTPTKIMLLTNLTPVWSLKRKLALNQCEWALRDRYIGALDLHLSARIRWLEWPSRLARHWPPNGSQSEAPRWRLKDTFIQYKLWLIFIVRKY